jgi:uncharacterized protein (TIGR00299 family) protein
LKILYYDVFCGISGDMNLAAMLDLGVNFKYLKDELSKLELHGYSITAEKAAKNGITGTQVNVILDSDSHEHEHHHTHRTFKDIKKIINNSTLNDNIKNISITIFNHIAEAEGEVHGKPAEEVAFHEVGAIDSIVDIVGAAICIDSIKPDAVYSSPVELGGGFVTCAHGTLPVPAPATVHILSGVPVTQGKVDGETTTPTGAAILKTLSKDFTKTIPLTIKKTGYGIGHKDFSIPNVLRVYIAETSKQLSDTSQLLECNIDDMNPEYYDTIFEKLFSAGAKDVFITPIIMKKSRPAVKLSVLCSADTSDKIKKLLFIETTTLGIRVSTIKKEMLERKHHTVDTKYGQVSVKCAYMDNKCIKAKFEYEDIKKISLKNNIPISALYTELSTVLEPFITGEKS